MGHFGDESFQSITFAGTDTWQETEFEYLRTLLIHAMRVIVVLPDYQTDRDRQEHWSSKKSDVEVCDQWPLGVLGEACWTGRCWFGPIRGVNGPRRLHADRTCLGVSARLCYRRHCSSWETVRGRLLRGGRKLMIHSRVGR